MYYTHIVLYIFTYIIIHIFICGKWSIFYCIAHSYVCLCSLLGMQPLALTNVCCSWMLTTEHNTLAIRLMEKIPHHVRCPKRSWYRYTKYISGILSGAGFFPSTVSLDEHSRPSERCISQALSWVSVVIWYKFDMYDMIWYVIYQHMIWIDMISVIMWLCDYVYFSPVNVP